MKRIIRIEEVIDFFLSQGIEKLLREEIWITANRMIKKQNKQAEKDNRDIGFFKYDYLKEIEEDRELDLWVGLKVYINEKLKKTESLSVYRKKSCKLYCRGGVMEDHYLSRSKYYEMLSFIYRYAEKYIYYNRLVVIKI